MAPTTATAERTESTHEASKKSSSLQYGPAKALAVPADKTGASSPQRLAPILIASCNNPRSARLGADTSNNATRMVHNMAVADTHSQEAPSFGMATDT
jgi:hypothetical protein